MRGSVRRLMLVILAVVGIGGLVVACNDAPDLLQPEKGPNADWACGTVAGITGCTWYEPNTTKESDDGPCDPYLDDCDPCYIDPYGTECSGGGGTNPPADDGESETPCATGDMKVDSHLVQPGFDRLWAESNYKVNGVIQDQNDRREKMGFIIATSYGYDFVRNTSLVSGPCGLDGTVNVPPQAVAFVHTHPWMVGEAQTSCPSGGIYFGEPSDDDRQMSAAWGIPGYILDASGITKFSSAPNENTDARFSRCGY